MSVDPSLESCLCPCPCPSTNSIDSKYRYITTPYYRTVTPTHALGCTDEPDFTYKRYDFFVINSRLYPFLYKLLSREVVIFFRGIQEKDRVNIVIRLEKIADSSDPMVPNTLYPITNEEQVKIQEKVDEILSVDAGYCLINREELYRSGPQTYPYSWFNLVLPYVNINSSYNPFVQEEGIFLGFNPDSNYNLAYSEVVKYILDTLDKFYQDGVIFGSLSSSLIERWGMERIDVEEPDPKLFQPVWEDKRITGGRGGRGGGEGGEGGGGEDDINNTVDFLTELSKGSNAIRIGVSSNMVRRHYIAYNLNAEGIEMMLDGHYLKATVNSLDQAQKVASIVEYSEAIADGKIVTTMVNRPSWVYLFMETAREELGIVREGGVEGVEGGVEEVEGVEGESMIGGCTGYNNGTIENPYTFSCIIDRKDDQKAFLEMLRQKVYQKLALIQKQNPGISPHDVVEIKYMK